MRRWSASIGSIVLLFAAGGLITLFQNCSDNSSSNSGNINVVNNASPN